MWRALRGESAPVDACLLGLTKVGHDEVGHLFVSDLIFFMYISGLGEMLSQSGDVRPQRWSDAIEAHLKAHHKEKRPTCKRMGVFKSVVERL